MVFQHAMTKEFGKIDNLVLIGKRITNLITGSGLMRRMPNLKELNLSNNKIVTLSPLNELKSLHTLILNGNRI